MIQFSRKAAVVIGLATLSTLAAAALGDATRDKDIVIDRVTATAQTPAAAAQAEAMRLSVLLESRDGALTPRGTDRLFRTGDRLRVKILTSRAGRISLYNTNPKGETLAQPIWQGVVKAGQELVTPRLALRGHSGVDLLHVVLEPVEAPAGVSTWLTQWLQSSKAEGGAKDIRLDVRHAETHTELVHPAVAAAGRGLVGTIQIVHTVR